MFEVIVGNIGTVHEGDDFGKAITHFQDYRHLSAHGVGRGGYEDVTLMHDGNPIREWVPPNRGCGK